MRRRAFGKRVDAVGDSRGIAERPPHGRTKAVVITAMAAMGFQSLHGVGSKGSVVMVVSKVLAHPVHHERQVRERVLAVGGNLLQELLESVVHDDRLGS